jgi:hypothetical protein
MWGTAWTPADINGSGFGVVVAIKNWTSSVKTAKIDHLNLTVYYGIDKTATETGSGSDTILSVTATVPISELSGAVESILSPIPQLVQELIASQESVGISAALPISDPSAAQENISIGIPIQDQGGLDNETVSQEVHAPYQDVGFLVDICHRIQGTLTLDGDPLPHVQSLTVYERTGLGETLISGSPTLPRREQTGKFGRIVVVIGRVAISEMEALKALADGNDHFLMLPTGDSLRCHVNPVTVKYSTEDPSWAEYSLELLERVDDLPW